MNSVLYCPASLLDLTPPPEWGSMGCGIDILLLLMLLHHMLYVHGVIGVCGTSSETVNAHLIILTANLPQNTETRCLHAVFL